jgi:phosphatidylinositol-3-phosphatase
MKRPLTVLAGFAIVGTLVAVGGILLAVRPGASDAGEERADIQNCAQRMRSAERPGFAVNSRRLPAFSHVVVIVMENKECGDVIGNRRAPFLNTLASRYALATSYFAIRHPSLPNYLALTGGSTFGIASDCTACRVRATNLVDQLERAGLSWKAYMEGLPRPCYRGAVAGRYAKKHNPFVYYDDVVSNPARCSRVVPLANLRSDLDSGELPAFSWITPDSCHDMHDCGVAAGDRFLAGLVPRLLRAIGPKGVLFITWDEGESDSVRGCCGTAVGGRVATIVAGPLARTGVAVGVPYDHYSLLRTIEDAWQLPELRNAGCPCTRPLTALFAAPGR